MANFKLRRTHFPDKLLIVSADVRDQREAICKSCPFYGASESICHVNNKFVAAIITTKSAGCPMGQWSSHYGS